MTKGVASDTASAYQVEFTHQPHPTNYRFRYESENRKDSSFIGGVKSLQPEIEITGPTERRDLTVRITCITANRPHYIHPHSLVGEHCKSGYFSKDLISFDGTATLPLTKLGIQCAKRNEVKDALDQRMKDKIDPFKKGFSHLKKLTKTDLTSVRLCVQVYVKGCENQEPLCRIVSDRVNDKKYFPKLSIHKLSHDSASVQGGTKMFIMCEKVDEGDIRVEFFTEFRGKREAIGKGEVIGVFKGYVIEIKTPQYLDTNVSENVPAFVRLYRHSDNTHSQPKKFRFLAENRPRSHSLRNFSPQELQNEVGHSNRVYEVVHLPPLITQPQINYNYDIIQTPPKSPVDDQYEILRNHRQSALELYFASEQTQNINAEFASPSSALHHHPSQDRYANVEDISTEKLIHGNIVSVDDEMALHVKLGERGEPMDISFTFKSLSISDKQRL